MSSKRKTKSETPPPESFDLFDVANEADLMVHISYCLEVTCKLVDQLQAAGKCSPELLPSLRGIQLQIDRQTRALTKSGNGPKNIDLAQQLLNLSE